MFLLKMFVNRGWNFFHLSLSPSLILSHTPTGTHTHQKIIFPSLKMKAVKDALLKKDFKFGGPGLDP